MTSFVQSEAAVVEREGEVESISRWLALVEIAILGALLLLFNFYSERLGVYGSFGDPSTFSKVLTANFAEHLPWLNLWWGLALVLALARFTTGRRTPALRWAEAGLSMYGLAVLARLVLGGPILQPVPEWDARIGGTIVSLSWPQNSAGLANSALKALLVFGILGRSIDLARSLVRLGLRPLVIHLD